MIGSRFSDLVGVLETTALECQRVDYRAPKPDPSLAELPDARRLPALVLALRDCNHRLWHLEDEARRTDAGDAHVAAVKRAIDRWNQRRSDLTERIDHAILAGLPAAEPIAAGLNSETPGMILDRLSILKLKIFHFDAFRSRALSTALHAEITEKIRILEAQFDDLTGCFQRMIDDASQGRRHFRLYRQFKAYDDPRLNPVLHRAG